MNSHSTITNPSHTGFASCTKATELEEQGILGGGFMAQVRVLSLPWHIHLHTYHILYACLLALAHSLGMW